MIAPSFTTAARHDNDTPTAARMDPQRRKRAADELAAEHHPMTKRRRRRPARLRAFAGFGAALRRLRRRAGLTQIELARAAAMTRPMISSFERETTIPGLDTLDRLLTALGVTVVELARELEGKAAPR